MDSKETWIEKEILFYKDRETIEQLAIGNLQYAYVQILGHVPYLFVFADHQHYISTELKGFEMVYQELSHQFHFDDATFYAVCKAKVEDDKVKIWAKKHAQNYHILEEYLTDGDLGYEVYTTPKQMISWDITYEQLEASGVVEAYFTDYGSKYLRFKYAVRVEGIRIDQLEVYVNPSSAALPVQEYFVSIYDETNTDESYKQLRELWIDDAIDMDAYGYEREDQCYLQFVLAKGISASICYTYDKEHGYDDGSTSLHFYNKRDYDYFLENTAYEEIMELAAFLPFSIGLDLQVGYKDREEVKRIPPKIKEVKGNKSGIWVDHKTNTIGFAGLETALILDLDKIKNFTFQNALPAKGAGYADLIVHFKTHDYLYVFTADTYFFDQFANQLKQMTKKSVSIPEAYYNC
ncbi:hypothetical protein QNH98_02550 [Myroides sp. mNGS23_01]|nr:hypothetical protein [Myroides sp. mNGS23_01]WHT39598.1 hypothetical protein QNH98_02550 [Myroides sp. mNGS23_01]